MPNARNPVTFWPKKTARQMAGREYYACVSLDASTTEAQRKIDWQIQLEMWLRFCSSDIRKNYGLALLNIRSSTEQTTVKCHVLWEKVWMLVNYESLWTYESGIWFCGFCHVSWFDIQPQLSPQLSPGSEIILFETWLQTWSQNCTSGFVAIGWAWVIQAQQLGLQVVWLAPVLVCLHKHI